MATEVFKLQGADQILRKLRALSPKWQKKVITASMRKGMRIVAKAAQQRAKLFDDPATAQKIYKEIVVRTNNKKGKRAGGFLVQVGVRGGARAYVDNVKNRRQDRVGKSYEGGGNVYHWRFLEFGTKFMRAQPFMRPALEENAEDVSRVMVTELNIAIDKALSGVR